ncbi:HEPN domain-containing protein [Clostridium sp.]|uniref:ApeA N-terminal domain 1-containing protein n=1 Tax=Clostridium sp. TaxID=1506 RepID=UPI00290EB2CF|nr:HEPN domain-containing protein [Clostridium sp.]MDU5108088.1 hypothetical protein [Clostridium sp.]
MSKEDRYIGQWYLPSNKENIIFGELIIDNEKNIKLDLCGNFGGINGLNDLGEEKTINGFTKCGKEITLSNCKSMGLNISLPGIPNMQYKPSFVIMGKEYDNLNSCLVRELEAEFTSLEKWLNMNPFEFEINDTEKEYNVYYKLPQKMNYNCEGFNFSICFGGKVNTDRLKSAEIKQRTYIKFELNEEIPLIESLDYIHDFSRFLTLCIGEEVNASNIRIKDNSNKVISVYWNRMKDSNLSNKKTNDILIPFCLISYKFGDIIQRWYRIKNDLEPIINYIIEGYDKVFHIPMTFIKIVQALEAFSRKMRSNNKEDISSYKEKIKYILESVDNEDYKSWLEGRLKYSNEPTLQNRIKDIFYELDFFLKLSSSERKSIANKITLTRNYYTHFDEMNKENVMTDEEIYYSTVIMQLALRVLVMMELGIDRELIDVQIINCESYKLNMFNKYFKKKKE